MFKRIYIYIIATLTLTLVSQRSHAQYDVAFSHYFDMEPSFNAASVGKQSKLNVSAAYAMDFAGFKHNPRTMYVGADMPLYFLKSYHGVGLQFMNDKIGLFTHQRLALQYALRLKMFGGQLAAGVSAGLLSETFDGTQLDLEDTSDPAFASSKLDGNSVDLALLCTTLIATGMPDCRCSISTRRLSTWATRTSCRLTLPTISRADATYDCATRSLR